MTVVLMLLVSVLGIPLALILLALYFAALIIGLLVGKTWIGDVGFRKFGRLPEESK